MKTGEDHDLATRGTMCGGIRPRMVDGGMRMDGVQEPPIVTTPQIDEHDLGRQSVHGTGLLVLTGGHIPEGRTMRTGTNQAGTAVGVMIAARGGDSDTLVCVSLSPPESVP